MAQKSKESFQQVHPLIEQQADLRAFITSMMQGSPDVQHALQDTNLVVWEKIAARHFLFQPLRSLRATAALGPGLEGGSSSQ
jgi:hypothetical protein